MGPSTDRRRLCRHRAPLGVEGRSSWAGRWPPSRVGYRVRLPFGGCPSTPQDVLLAEYRLHLEGERGLAPGTVTHYLRFARRFLTWLPGPLAESLPTLAAEQVVNYVLGWTAARWGKDVDTMTLPALRS